MPITGPFHEGELLAQRLAGEEEIAAHTGRAIGDSIAHALLKFFAKQPLVVLGARDADERLWASMLFGRPGFLRAKPRVLEIDLETVRRINSDPLWDAIERESRVGALVIELETRRRIRVNGRLARPEDAIFRIDIDEAYPNCPKYIQRRVMPTLDTESGDWNPATTRGEALGDEQLALISAADTFFVASAHAERGLDVSHRGGGAGFVRILGDRTLRIPDYAGNSMFNTLGNLLSEPRSGVVIPDFASGRVLQITGEAIVDFSPSESEIERFGAARFWNFQVDEWIDTANAMPANWTFVDASPHNPRVA